MQIHTYPVGQLQANCYFLIEDKNCLIIDPGDSADFILEKIQQENLNVVGLLATHGHFDHIMATGEIQLSLNVPFYIHKDDLFLVKRLNETAKYFLGFDPHAFPPKKIEFVKPGNFQISNFIFQIIETPGHTPGSCCFYLPEENCVFTGDTLFKQAIGRYDFSYSNKTELMKSLQTLFRLPEETIVLSGHGNETTVGEENDLLMMRS
jgi:glyoxylase-like metal-dependent hydrolase (beta-lactamase superfamily II)